MKLAKIADGVYRGTGKWKLATGGENSGVFADNSHLNVYFYPSSAKSENTINRIKLERGTVGTDWTPAPEDNDGLQEVRGTVQVVQNTLAKATGDIKSLGERITTAQSTADGNKATVQAHAKSINGLEAQYTVKVDVNGKVAGYGLATTPKNGTPESKFIVNADRFGIGAPGKADVFPFTVDTQQNRVGVNGELVVNGKAIVDKLNAGDIHGDKITANTLNANRLKAGSITAREIGVDRLSAISANLGDIRGGRMDLGNGRFVVENNGEVSLSSSSGQVGMKLKNERLTVHDTRGYLRVIVGYKGNS